MANKKAQRLALKKEGLRNLTSELLGAVVGGLNPQPLPPHDPPTTIE
jgi:hypothetical protein